MLFNTPEYIAFFCIVFVLFYATNRQNALIIRNLLLLIASLYFYAALHWWYALLLLYTLVVHYICGLWIDRKQKAGRSGKFPLAVSIVASLTVLIFFKYAYIYKPSIFLPIGLSFYTFQSLTYTIDIYRKKISVNKNLLEVGLFIAFFPTLLSGPIERARNLMPQLRKKKVISCD
jgi:D-alanyl-lipoteichoic acid acyltransferase DltB (MBOAT superfamily)